MGRAALPCETVATILSRETTDNFWQVITTFRWPEPEPVQYRLYHDEQGQPLFYSMEALPGTYIEVDQATYVLASHSVQVQNGVLVVVRPQAQVSWLAPDTESGTACDPRDVCVVVSSDKPHQKWKKLTHDIH